MLQETPQFERAFGIAASQATRRYHPEIIGEIQRRLPNSRIAVRTHAFPNDMPLYLVGNARHVLMISWVNGDNWQQAYAEIGHIGSAFTLNVDAAGPNTEMLGVLLPFADTRQERRTQKCVPDSTDKAIVRSQSVSTITLAREIRHVAQAKYVAALDLHSLEAAQAFTNVGLELIHLSAAKLFADEIKKRGYINGDLETIVSTTDLGGLPRAYKLSQLLDTDLAIVLKDRFTVNDGPDSTVTQTNSRLVYGDVADKRVILFDDMIGSGGTSENAVKLMLKYKASEIILCATHPVFAPETYYRTLQRILMDERVTAVMVTNSIPIEDRTPSVSIPYVRFDGNRIKRVDILPIGDFLAYAAEVILKSPDIDTAKNTLRPHTLEMESPFDIYEKVTNQTLQPPQTTAVYHEGGEITPLPFIT